MSKRSTLLTLASLLALSANDNPYFNNQIDSIDSSKPDKIKGFTDTSWHRNPKLSKKKRKQLKIKINNKF